MSECGLWWDTTLQTVCAEIPASKVLPETKAYVSEVFPYILSVLVSFELRGSGFGLHC